MLLSSFAAALLALSRPAMLSQPRPALSTRAGRIACQAPVGAPTLDLVGDGGVLKAMSRAGAGGPTQRGATVEVHYVGTLLETGAVFDSSRARGKVRSTGLTPSVQREVCRYPYCARGARGARARPAEMPVIATSHRIAQPFKFTIGEGNVIGGWEVGVASMQPGELSTLTCGPQYAYGEKEIPPMIPPSSTLQFEVELLSVQAPVEEAGSFAAYNEAPRTPGEISAAYQHKMAAKTSPLEGLEGVVEWAKKIYIFGLFSSKGERCARARSSVEPYALVV